MFYYNLQTMRCTLIVISDSDKHFASACAEYEKRLWNALNLVVLAPVRQWTHEQIIKKETLCIIAALEKMSQDKRGPVVLLSKEGKEMTTEQFCWFFEQNTWCTCIIGGPYGLDEELLAPHVAMRLSFGKQTMPHGLAKLVFLEQLYRVSMIQQGRTYHY